MGVTHTGVPPQTLPRMSGGFTLAREEQTAADNAASESVQRPETVQSGFEVVRSPHSETSSASPLQSPTGVGGATRPREATRTERTSFADMAANRNHRLAGTVGPKGANDPADVQWVAERLNAHVDSDGKPYLEPGGDVFRALARFQGDRTGHRDGQADPGGDTEFALGSSPAHRLGGSVGAGGTNNRADVARVQSALALEGRLSPTDYTPGEINANDPNDPTVRAIKGFQENVRDGRVDLNRSTHKRFKRAARAGRRGLPIARTVGGRRASNPDDVRLVQDRLVVHGELEQGAFQPGERDEATQAAIRSFQGRFMRRPDGRVNPGKDTSRYLSMTPEALARQLNPGTATEQDRLTWGSGPANDDVDTANDTTPVEVKPAPEAPTGDIYVAQAADTPLSVVERNYVRADGSALNEAEKQILLPVIAGRNADRLPHLADGRIGEGDRVVLPSAEELSEYAGFDVKRGTIPIPRPRPQRTNDGSPTLGTVGAIRGPMDITAAPPASVRQAIDDAGRVEGIPLRWMYNIAKVESNFNAGNRTGSYVGLYQMSASEMARHSRQRYRSEGDRPLQVGLKGPRTLQAQQNLRALGYDIEDDTYYGQEMRWAISHYQANNPDLVSDGVGNEATLAAIAADVAEGKRGGPFVYPHRDIEQTTGTSRTDARTNAFAFARMTADRIRRMSLKWGRPVEEFEIYMMHQQGESGWSHHVSNPEGAAWRNFQRATGNKWSAAKSKRAIWGNMSRRMRSRFPGGVETVTSGDFIREWRDAYDLKRRGLPM